MNNAQTIEAAGNLPALHGEREKLARQIGGLKDKLRTVSETIHQAEKVDEIYDGVALQVFSMMGTTVKAVSDELTTRYARYAENANNGSHGTDHWLLYTGRNSFGAEGERWHGAWFSKDEVEKWARDWVAHGTVPPVYAAPSNW